MMRHEHGTHRGEHHGTDGERDGHRPGSGRQHATGHQTVHGHANANHHDHHIGGDGRSHIAGAVEELDRQHPMHEQSPHAQATQKTSPPKAPRGAEASASPGVHMGPGKPTRSDSGGDR